MKIKVIGDIHSRPSALKKALKENPDYYPIFLGDILDGRAIASEKEKTNNDLKTIQLLKNIDFKLIIGNHDKNLFFLNLASSLTKNTFNRLENTPELKWFRSKIRDAESFFSFEVGKIRYDLAHAYPFKDATEKEQTYGVKVDNLRLKWFKNYLPEENIFKISGHYHEILLADHFCVLDGDSKSENCLPCLLIDKNNKTLLKYTC